MDKENKKMILVLNAEEMVTEDSFEKGEIKDKMSMFIDNVRGKVYRDVKSLAEDLDAMVNEEDAYFMDGMLCWDFYAEAFLSLDEDSPEMKAFKEGKINLDLHRVRVRVKIIDSARDPEEGEMEREFGVKEIKD